MPLFYPRVLRESLHTCRQNLCKLVSFASLGAIYTQGCYMDFTDHLSPAQNPLSDGQNSLRGAAPCIMVIFGATGDLTRRRLVPALYHLAREGQLPAHFCCVGFARRDKSHEDFRAEMLEAIRSSLGNYPFDPSIWESVRDRLFYHRSEFDNDEGYEKLRQFLKDLDNRYGTQGNRVYYLSTQPRFFPTIVEKLHAHQLIYNTQSGNSRWSRVIIEKPFGHDYKSAVALQQDIRQFLAESQIYRIDHWLGKETVQNLLAFRFTNPIFEAVWNHNFIDHIQITVGESIGIGTRGDLWEQQGILRDIVQNHVMQLLCLIAMEPPSSLSAECIRDEKVKVLNSMRPIDLDNLEQFVVRGQYGPGFITGEPVVGYRDEQNVPSDSNATTFAALKLFVDNWRWNGVPIYVRAGKRMPKRVTEIAITFKEAPGRLFSLPQKSLDSNVLAIRIQPNEDIALKINCKVPGHTQLIHPVKMDFRYGSYFGASQQEAYERLLCDCMVGDSTLFARDDEVLQSWRLFTPILERWANTPPRSFPNYQAGQWGPREADLMIQKEGRRWRLP